MLSYQDGETIGRVAAALREGLSTRFGGLARQIVLVDGGSTDSTVARAREALGEARHVLEIANAGVARRP